MMDTVVEMHSHLEATYRIISLPADAFGVEVAFPCSQSTLVTGFGMLAGCRGVGAHA